MKDSEHLKILIASGIYPPQVGGPAQYAKNLTEALRERGHKVKVLSFGDREYKLPAGLRHLLFFCRVLLALPGIDFVIGLDTFSAGLPALLAAKIARKKFLVRTGGDFLWESYVERTGDRLTLKEFNERLPQLTVKGKIIFFLTKWFLAKNDAVIFSTEWQRDIFAKTYGFDRAKAFLIENFYGPKLPEREFEEKKFLCAGRPIKLKNIPVLREAFGLAQRISPKLRLELISGMEHNALMKKIRSGYAMIIPSLSEVSPNLILEAIRANKPFIVTRETGLYEKLSGIGLFVDPKSVDDIREKILFLADDSNYARQKEMIAKFDFVHTWDQIADEFIQIYSKL